MPEKQDIIPLVYGTTLFRFFILIMLFLSLLYGQQSLVILSLLLLTLFSLARIWCRFSQRGLEYQLTSTKEKIFAGEDTVLKARVRNHKFLPVWLEISVVLDKLLDFDLNSKICDYGQVNGLKKYNTPRKAEAIIMGNKTDNASESQIITSNDPSPFISTKATVHGKSSLFWKQQAEWEWKLKPLKRGQYIAGPVKLTTGDIFGLYKSEAEAALQKKITVYPRLVKLNPLSPLFKELFGMPGSKSPVVDPFFPVSTRDYSASRPARHIHWKASARHDHLQEKVFEPSTQEKKILVIDVSGFSEDTDLLFEKTLEAVASLAVYLEKKGRTFGLISNGMITAESNQPSTAILPTGAGSHQLLLLLDMLARLKSKTQNEPLATLLQQTIQGSGITALYFNHSILNHEKSTLNIFSRLKIPTISISAQKPTSFSPEAYSLDQLISNREIAAR